MLRSDGLRLVAERGHRGFGERSFEYRGQEFIHRTSYFHGRTYQTFYQPYVFRGAVLSVYQPAAFYPAPFYGWVYNPWVAPVSFAWGFASSPWYGYYGGYFVPQPTYSDASAWLTDYMVSNSLADGYQARVDAGLPMTTPPSTQGGQSNLTHDVQALIAAEIRRQVSLEYTESLGASRGEAPGSSSSSIQRMLSDGTSHIFLVGDNMDLNTSSGQECAVTAGDILQLGMSPPSDANSATLVVLASKGGECPKSSTVIVTLTDLQELQNYMRQMVDQGLADIQKRQVRGLPLLPPSATTPPANAPYTQGAPPMEPNIATELALQDQETDNAEREANQEAGASSAP